MRDTLTTTPVHPRVDGVSNRCHMGSGRLRAAHFSESIPTAGERRSRKSEIEGFPPDVSNSSPRRRRAMVTVVGSKQIASAATEVYHGSSERKMDRTI